MTMSKEEQIEELTNELVFTNRYGTYNAVAEYLINKGYHKQSHGTWYHGTENGAVYAKCSACGRKMDYSCYGYAYCSLCGARMDGSKEQEAL